MEHYLQEKLGTKLFKRTGKSGSGCISNGEAYETDFGIVYVKKNSKVGADIMFKGEFKGLQAIQKTGTIAVPKAIDYGHYNQLHYIVMDYVDIKSINKYEAQLGENLAKMHRDNSEKCNNYVGENIEKVEKFGFEVPTSCGFLPQDNTWCEDWVQFYSKQKLDSQIRLILEKTSDKDLLEKWSVLQIKIPQFFKDITIYPSLLHGDLWSGNSGETEKEGIIFDPAVFYGHHECDLAIAHMFGGFSSTFYKAYHNIIPKEKGYEKRLKLYQLFHQLNHWNHFGSSYRGATLDVMKYLIDI